MKSLLVFIILAMFTIVSFAHGGQEPAAKGKPIAVTGEVVDMTCYMQHPASATGGDHAKCAKSCITKGLPIGFLSTDGTLYSVIGPEHDPVSTRVMDYLGKPSTISGTLVEHHGVKAIELSSIRSAVIGPKEAAQPGGMPGTAPVNDKSPVFYTCEMHPEIHTTTPGVCPKCGMELVPEKKK